MTLTDSIVPDGFQRFSDAVNRLAEGMWGGLRQPFPVSDVKRTSKNASVILGPRREQAGQRLTAAAIAAELPVYLFPESNSPANAPIELLDSIRKPVPLTPRGEQITYKHQTRRRSPKPLQAAGPRVPCLIRAWSRWWTHAFHRQGFFRHLLLFISMSVFAKYLLHLVADQFEPAIPFRVSLDSFPFWLFLPDQVCVSHCGNRLAER
jgi:hypothetical protein